MKKLEEIPKKNVFEMPDGYFDRLPGIIQSRISETEPIGAVFFSWRVTLRYAVPILVMLTLGIGWYESQQMSSNGNIRLQLAAIRPSELAAYLEEHDVATEDLVETASWSPDDLSDLENSVYSDLDVSRKAIENMIDENDVEL